MRFVLHAFVLALLAFFPARAAERDRTEVRITGDPSISEKQLLQALGGRLDHIYLHPAKPSRAADAAFMVEEVYQKAGFNDVVIFWKILGPRSIQLRIEEGPRDLLGNVTVSGIPNPKLHKALIDLFRLTPRKRAAGFKQVPFRKADLEEGIALMDAQLRSLGFYAAKIEVASQTKNPKTGRIDFDFAIQAGPSFTIAAPTFQGETPPGLRAAISSYTGEVAHTAQLNALRARVAEVYQTQGFVEAVVRMKLVVLDRSVRPEFIIEKGEKVVLRDIRFTGQQKTNPERIEVRLRDLKGTTLDGTLARKRIGQIIGTGAFSTLRTELQPVGDGTVDALLHIQEADARGVSTSAGFDTFEGPILGATYHDRNLFGQVRNLNAGLEISQRSILGDITVSDPWIHGSDISGRARLYAQSRDYEGYDAVRSGFEAALVWPVNDHYRLELIAGWSINDLSSDGIPIANLGATNYSNPAILFNQRLDYRDNPVMPTSGWHLEIPLEIGAAIGRDTTPYAKFGFESSYLHPLGSKGRLALGLRSHLLIPADDRRLPIDLRLFTGGARSVRSFRERELGPWSITGYPIGGQAMWVANLEYSRSLAGPLRGVAFIDAGGLSRDWEDFGLSDPEVAAGLGLRLDLPIGPVRLEYGHNLTRDGRDPSGTFHFAIGTTF
ncbi:MAG: BamA/TamA family outer membrane protein [Akkermansiaceae bacterium]|jgi:outer membrane protein assembly complex protein YaeT|nr:BamA/TamA family outer membrane protein [Akkermansiaceae bacterium]